jgi:hypothetical protein
MQAYSAAHAPKLAALRLRGLIDQAKANGHWGETSDEAFKTAILRIGEQAAEANRDKNGDFILFKSS